MFILGLLLVAGGALVILTAVFTAEETGVMLGNDLTTLTIFLLGLAAGLAIVCGFLLVKLGTARSLQRRREHKQLTELSQKLDAVEAERSDDERKD